MEESVVADFVGRIHSPDIGTDEPVKGRVVLSQRRLVLVGPDDRTTIPLSSVFDVAVGTVPSDLQTFFSDTVTIAYRNGDRRQTALIEGEPDVMVQFRTVLFKALLRDVTATVRHPAKVGGRVVDSEPQRASIKLEEGRIGFVDCRDPFAVDLSTVIEYDRERRTIDGTTRPALSFRHADDGRLMTSIVAVPDDRCLTILGRYIKLEYSDVKEETEDLDPTEEELEILVALYTAGEDASLADIVTGDATRASMILDGLREDGLVVDGERVPTLTAKGQIVVSTYLETVNA